jgi:hypothetical protein
MTAKKVTKENAKTRYNAKKPTVSFRVSLEEYECLDALRKNGMTFRTIVLKGAGMIEKEKVNKKRLKDEENRRIQEAIAAAKNDALKKIRLGYCPKCRRPMLWNLTNLEDKKLLDGVIMQSGIKHVKCPP